jgi:hypothetical protein
MATKPEMIKKIDSILEKVKDPESGFIAAGMMARITKDLEAAFKFPDLSVEFV